MEQTSAAMAGIQVYIRWGIRRDMPEVVAIEAQCFPETAWDEDAFIRVMRQPNNIMLVAEHDEKLVGFMVYELHKNRFYLLNFAVHEDYRYKGVGRQLVEKLKDKLSHDRRNRIVLEIRETNLDGHLFFQRMGFRCISVLRGFYEEVPDDAYLFQYRLGQGESY